MSREVIFLREWLVKRWLWWVITALVVGVVFFRLFRLLEVPPGLHYDEAANAILARDVSPTNLTAYFSAYTGRPALYIYLLALIFSFLGPTLFALRFLNFLISLVTLVVTFLFLRELYGNRIATLATAVWATTFWPLAAGRYAIANVLMPPLEGLAFLFLWQGYRKGKLGCLIVGGGLVGLTLYSYASAIFFPLAVLLIFIALALLESGPWRLVFPKLFLAGLAGFLVSTPLIVHFLQGPEDFWERPDQVLIFRSLPSEEWLPTIAKNTLETIAGFAISGDPNWRVNFPPRPIFDVILAAAFFGGLALALRRFRRPEYLISLLWLGIMLLPSIATIDLNPVTQRMMGTWPILFAFPALGLDRLREWLSKQLKGRRVWLSGVFLTGLFIFEGSSTFQAYFNEWANAPQVYQWYDAAYVEMVPLIKNEIAQGREVIIGSAHYRHTTIAFLDPRLPRRYWMVGGNTILVPVTEAEELAYIIALSDNPQAEGALRFLRAAASDTEIYSDPAGNPAILLYLVDKKNIPAPPSDQLRNRLNGEIALESQQLPTTVRRDEPLTIKFSWQVLKRPTAARSLVVHLVDRREVLWAQASEAGFIWDQWRRGDRAYQWLDLSLPQTMPPGHYAVRLLLTDAAANPFPVLNEGGEPQGIYHTLGHVEVLPAGGLWGESGRTGLPFGDALQVLDSDQLNASLPPGGRLQFSVTWQAMKELEDFDVEFDFRDARGDIWATYTLPLGYDYPTSHWQVGEVVRPIYALDLGAEAPAGMSQVVLKVPGLTGELNLGVVDVRGEGRIFTVPEIEHPLPATLGEGQIRFLGYDLAKLDRRSGEGFDLRLYWQAQGTIAEDYKVFVHLLNASGQILVQDDAVPAGWTRPTRGWVEGEVIVDEHHLLIPPDITPGEYTLVMGMYEVNTLARLPVYDQEGIRQPQDRLVLEVCVPLPLEDPHC